MTIAFSFTDEEALATIEACRALTGNPVLWLLSDRLEKAYNEQTARQAEASTFDRNEERKRVARDAWSCHLFSGRGSIRCHTCANALQGALGPNGVTHMLTNTCAQGKILYQNLLNSLE